MRRRSQAVDTRDARALARRTRVARLVRVALGLAALGLAAAAVAFARDLEVRPKGLLPTGTTGILVADLSLSIDDENYDRIRSVLQRLVAANEPIGLVVFSDVAYELLPPGTPAKELRPILRLLASGQQRLKHPWEQGFRAGTRISQAVELARALLLRDRISPGSILLLSDLETAPDDLDALARILQTTRRDGIRMRVLPLSPSRESLELFQGVLGPEAIVEAPTPSANLPEPSPDVAGPLPVLLLALAGACLAALALHERLGARLALPRGGAR